MSKATERLPSDYVETIAVRNLTGGLSLVPKLSARLAEVQQIVAEAQVAADPSEWRKQFSSVGELDPGGVPMLIENFLPAKGISMLGALPGNCKTLLALSLVKALITSAPFLGRFKVVSQTPCLYLIPESNGASFRMRCEKFEIPDDPDLFLCRTISNGGTLLMDDRSIMAAVQHLKPVVFLDTAIRFNRATDENSSSGNKKFVDDAVALLAGGAQAVFGLHHATKNSRKDGLTLESALRGTGDLAAMASAVFGLKRNDALYKDGDGPLELDLINLKARDFEAPRPIVIAASAKVDDRIVSHIDTKHDFVVLETEDIICDTNNRFLELIKADPDLSYREIADALKISPPKVQRIAKKLGFVKTKTGWVNQYVEMGTSNDAEASAELEV
jgi:hypothetical protein